MATTATSTSTATATVTSVATSTSTATTTTTTQTQTHDDYNTRCNENSNGGDDVDGVDGNDDETATTATADTAATAAATIALAKEIAEQIHSSADILLEKLFSHLSKLPEEEEEEEIVNDCTSPTTRTCTSLLGENDNENDTQLLQRGITIPVSAVAWLSGQFDALEIFNNNNNNNNTDNDNENDNYEEHDKSQSHSQSQSQSKYSDSYYDIEQWIGIESTVSLRYRLNLLRFILPRIQLIRVTRQPWPFTTTDKDNNNNNTTIDRIDNDINNVIITTNTNTKLKSWFWRKRRHRHQQQLLHTTTSSTTTAADADANAAEEFLRYTKMLIHGGGGGSGISTKYVNLPRVFPNAKVLILEGVPPSWIDLNNQIHQNQNQNNNNQKNPATGSSSCSCSHSTPTSSRLQVITVRKAAIYNLNEFLGTYHHHHHHHRRKKEEQQESIITEEKEDDDTTVTGLSTTTTTTEPLQLEISIEGRMQQQQQHQEKVTSLSLPLPLPSLSLPSLSLSLTHLKLESCCLGELTIGFISSIQQLDQLTYLSLRDNKFRKSSTILKAIQGLCKLQYMDISNNCLMNKFGPNANLYLGGQIRTVKLSGNLLRTCHGSGLEKCYAIQHLYLDNNLIDTVIEVSGLVRLPELQSIQLQNNPFTTNNNDNNISNSDNPSYDPDWKIRLWTWFQQERRVINPLELPNIGKRRMTKDEWDRIQQESFSSSSSSSSSPSSVLLAIDDTNAITTATATASTTSIGIETEIETRAVGDYDIVVAVAGDDTPPPLADNSTSSSVTEDSSIFLGSPLRPVRNRKVTKTSKPRQAKINNNNNNNFTYNDDDIKIHNNNNSNTKGERRQRRKKKISSHSSGRRRMQPLKTSPKIYDSYTNIITDTHDEDGKIHSTSTDGVGGLDLSFSLEDILVSLQQPHPQQQESEKLDQIKEIEEEERSNQQHGDKELSTSEIVSSKTEEGEIVSSIDNVEEKKVGGEENIILTSPYTNNRNNPFIEENENDVSKEESGINDVINDSTMVLDQKKATGDDKLIALKSEPENSKLKDDCHEADKESSIIRDNIDEEDDQGQSRTTDEASTTESSISTPRTSPQRPKTSTATSASMINIEDRIFLKPKMATIKLARGAPNYNKTFEVLDSDWEELIKRASEGRIPDGLLKSPVETTDEFRNNGAIGVD